MRGLSKAFLTLVPLTVDFTTALNIAYCSSDNTGSGFDQGKFY